METTEPLAPFEQRAEEMLCRVFKGMHHVNSLKKVEARYWTCLVYGPATHDFDELTRLVLAAHEYCIRVELGKGPRAIKVMLFDRNRSGDLYSRHPTIQEAIETWNSGK